MSAYDESGTNVLRSFSTSDCRANGFGNVGHGSVGEIFSPFSVVSVGIGTSLIGYTGLPVVLSNKKINPDLVGCAIASILFPSFVIVTNTGAVGRSRSHTSW